MHGRRDLVTIWQRPYTRGMPAGRWQIDRLAREVELVGRRGLPREQYYREVAARLRRVIDCDATCWHTLDPQTRLMTSEAKHELIDEGVYTPQTAPAAGARLVASEYFVQDVNTFASLASRRVPVGTLSRATGGHPERSTRYRDLLVPSGIPFELRAAFVTRGRCWGAVHIARREHHKDFTAQDASALARVTDAIADGSAPRFASTPPDRPTTAPRPDSSCSAANHIELITAPAHELLAAMRNPAHATTDEVPPVALLALAAFTRRRPRDGDRQPDAVAVPTPSGWITLHASLPDGHANGQVAIVLERAATPHATAVGLEAHGLTPREREIATLHRPGTHQPGNR